jgi:hypothetical protein
VGRRLWDCFCRVDPGNFTMPPERINVLKVQAVPCLSAPTASDIEGPTDFDRVDICFEAEISRGALDSRMAQERPNRL